MVRFFEGNRKREKGIGIIVAVFPAASHLSYAAFTAPPAVLNGSSDMLFRPRMAGGGVGFGCRPAVCSALSSYRAPRRHVRVEWFVLVCKSGSHWEGPGSEIFLFPAE